MTIIPPYIAPTFPVRRVAPFSYQDGETHLAILERLGHYVTEVVDAVNAEFGRNDQFFVDEVNKLIADVNGLVAQWLNVTVENNDVITAQIVNDVNTLTYTALNNLIQTQIADAELPVSDIVDIQRSNADSITADLLAQPTNSRATAINLIDSRRYSAAQIEAMQRDNADAVTSDIIDNLYSETRSAVISAASSVADSVTGDLIDVGSSETRAALNRAVDARVEAVASTIIANDPTLESAAVAAMSNASVQAQLAFFKGPFTTEMSPENAETGYYSVIPSVAAAHGFPGGVGGLLFIGNWNANAKLAIWEPIFDPPQEWKMRWTTAWSNWARTDLAGEHASIVAQDNANIDAWGASMAGWHNVPSALRVGYIEDAGGTPIPTKMPFKLLHAAQTNDIKYEIALSYPEPSSVAGSQSGSQMFIRYKGFSDAAYRPWMQLATFNDVGRNERAVRIASLRQRLGKRYTNGRVPIAFVVDHGTNALLNGIAGMFSSRGIRITLALNSDMYNPALPINANENLTDWDDIKFWHDTYNWEIANHTRTHGDFNTEEDIRHAVIGGRDELEANIPGAIVDTFVQIGTTSGTRYNGFNDGNTWDSYYEHHAGRTIMNSHAVVMGLVPNEHPNNSYAMTGENLIGIRGDWIDYKTGIDAMQARITEAVNAGDQRGIIIRLHPQLIGGSGYSTSAELQAFLTWLKTQITAGAVDVMPVREWSITERGNGIDRKITLPGGTTARRIGDVVFVRYAANLPAGTGTVVVDTLPAGYLPDNSEAAPYVAGESVKRADITYNGIVQFRGVETSGMYVTLSASYQSSKRMP